MKYKIYSIIIICLLCVGCSQSKPLIEPITESISATILLPSKKPLSNQKIILIPTELDGIVRPVILMTNDKGLFVTTEAENSIYPIQYKIYTILKSPKYKKYIPSKYYDREDDESDLIIDFKNITGNLTLKMNK